MSMRASLSAGEARGLALRSQHFGDADLVEPIDMLDKLGAIQMDSVNILARNHLLVPHGVVAADGRVPLLPATHGAHARDATGLVAARASRERGPLPAGARARARRRSARRR